MTTQPSGLPVNITYNGTSNSPAAAGIYTVVATIQSDNYQGGITNSLAIIAAPRPATATANVMYGFLISAPLVNGGAPDLPW